MAFRPSKKAIDTDAMSAQAWRDVVDPDLFLAIDDLELVAKGVVEGFMEGRHRSPFVGFSVEFDSHREYQPGDDIRYVNWKLWARHDRFYVKQFKADTNLNLHLLLDVSASMACDLGPLSKWRYATRAVAALGHLALKGRDAAGLALLSDRVQDHLPPRVHPTQLHELVAMLAHAVPAGKTDLAQALAEAAKLCRRRSLIVLFSDLFDDHGEIFGALDQLRYRGHEILVVQLLDPWERFLPVDGQYYFVDLENDGRIDADAADIRDAYIKAVDDWMATVRRECQDRGIDWICCTTADPLKDLLVDYLEKRSHTLG